MNSWPLGPRGKQSTQNGYRCRGRGWDGMHTHDVNVHPCCEGASASVQGRPLHELRCTCKELGPPFFKVHVAVRSVDVGLVGFALAAPGIEILMALTAARLARWRAAQARRDRDGANPLCLEHSWHSCACIITCQVVLCRRCLLLQSTLDATSRLDAPESLVRGACPWAAWMSLGWTLH